MRHINTYTKFENEHDSNRENNKSGKWSQSQHETKHAHNGWKRPFLVVPTLLGAASLVVGTTIPAAFLQCLLPGGSGGNGSRSVAALVSRTESTRNFQRIPKQLLHASVLRLPLRSWCRAM
jgi:hypothetical protein